VATATAPEAVFLPLAALAQGQPPAEIPERLAALGLKQFAPHEDTGQLALKIGIRAVPAFVLVDAGGVVRAVGGSDITQKSKQGLSIAEALAIASKGASTPTLGFLTSNPVFQWLHQKLPDLTIAELKVAGAADPGQDNLVYRKLSQYYGRGKRLLLFYWRPGCAHCEKVLPDLRAWYEAKRPADLNIVDITRGDTLKDAKSYIRDYPWVHSFDMDKSVMQRLKVDETPAIFLVSTAGEVTGIRTGEKIDWDAFLSTAPRAASSGTK
jgi:thiol-disulfide isomerase/thioredoxin